jgi:nudix-type nucleoside diphosphatase (YffH/AdpP family)
MTEGKDGSVKIESEEVLHRGWASLTRYKVEVRRRGRAAKHLDRLVEDHGNSAAVLPYDAARGTVLLSRQFRLAAHLNGHSGWLIEACAGMIGAGESGAEAAVREAREELGVALGDIAHVCDVFVSPGVSKERASLFLASYAPTDRVGEGGGTDEGEDIEVLEITLADAGKGVADGAIVDAKTIILIQALAALHKP